jgi:hypothetical protein
MERARHITKRLWTVQCVATLGLTALASGQAVQGAAAETAGRTLRLYIDCGKNKSCDFDYLRTEISWIDYVREPAVAQVQAIATSLDTGSGGTEVTLKFIGREGFAGLDDEVRFAIGQGATLSEQRQEFARVLKLGLAPYVLRTRDAARFEMRYSPPAPSALTGPTRDPWNFWVLNVKAYGNFKGQARSTNRQVTGTVSADRTTAQWKIHSSLEGSNIRNRYRLSDSTAFIGIDRSFYANGVIAGSLSAHVSGGVSVDGWLSSQDNIDFATSVAPVLEYNVFPYAEYTRRRLVFAYSAGINRFLYTDTTIYNKTRENLLDEYVSLWYATTQPWGNSFVGAKGSNYLADFGKNRMSFFGGLTLRIVKGLALTFDGSYSRIHDQISLAKEGASDEEVLLQLRQLRTSYSYSMYVGLGYTFGSVFNNVVNPRLERGGAGPP